MTSSVVKKTDMGWSVWGTEVLKVHGVSTVLLAVIVFGAWRTIEWSAANVVQPLVARQIELMRSIDESFAAQSQVLESLNRSTVALHTSVINTERMVRENQEIMRKTLTSIEANLRAPR